MRAITFTICSSSGDGKFVLARQCTRDSKEFGQEGVSRTAVNECFSNA